MFKFFQALANLTTNTQALADSMAEANENLRRNLALDHADDVPALEHENGDGKRKVRAAK